MQMVTSLECLLQPWQSCRCDYHPREDHSHYYF